MNPARAQNRCLVKLVQTSLLGCIPKSFLLVLNVNKTDKPIYQKTCIGTYPVEATQLPKHCKIWEVTALLKGARFIIIVNMEQ